MAFHVGRKVASLLAASPWGLPSRISYSPLSKPASLCLLEAVLRVASVTPAHPLYLVEERAGLLPGQGYRFC